MNEQTREAYKLVIADLDSKMEQAPSREMADACNFLTDQLELDDPSHDAGHPSELEQ